MIGQPEIELRGNPEISLLSRYAHATFPPQATLRSPCQLAVVIRCPHSGSLVVSRGYVLTLLQLQNVVLQDILTSSRPIVNVQSRFQLTIFRRSPKGIQYGTRHVRRSGNGKLYFFLAIY